jgi:ubiquinone/menaquinone biosynthesis C-methylase UbiE
MRSQFDKNYYYGDVYSNYDKFLDWGKIAKDLIKRFEFNSFLDIGCGCGNLIKEIRKRKTGVDAWGIDISQFAVEKADDSSIILANCKKLPFDNERFDTVHILGTFSYLPTIVDAKQAATEAWRVTRKIIIFDDVYNIPDEKSDDYDPYRKQVLSQKKWFSLWREIVRENALVETYNDEIIIKKYAK